MQVAGGYRRPLPDFVPEALRELITECWAQNPKERPPITEVVDQLYTLQRAPTILANGAVKGDQVKGPAKKGCCTIM